MRPTTTIITALTLALVIPTLAHAQTIRCTTTEKWQCSPRKACAALDPAKVWARVTPSNYERCDAKGCDRYPAVLSKAGDYMHVSVPSQGGMMVKVEMSTNRHVEVVSQMLDTLVSFGRCSPEAGQ